MLISAGRGWRDDMKPHFTLSQLTYLLGTAVVVGALLVTIFYLFHKGVRKRLGEGETTLPTPRTTDPTAFVLATLQGVISTLKEQLKEEQDLHRASAQRAQDQERLMETILQESARGLMVFDREGFLSRSNKLVRELLGPDAWARRRYPEVLGRDSKLGGLVSACLETGQATRDAKVEVRSAGGAARSLAVSVLPLLTRDGEVEGALCLFDQGVASKEDLDDDKTPGLA